MDGRVSTHAVAIRHVVAGWGQAPDPAIVSAGGSASGISAGDLIAANVLANFGAAAASTAQQLSTLPLPCSIVPV